MQPWLTSLEPSLKVQVAARHYKAHGVLLRKTDIEKLEKIGKPPPRAAEAVDLIGATFGSMNITSVAIPLYSRGVRIEVPGVVRDFSDPMVDTEFVIL